MKVIKGTRGCVFCKQPALDELDYGELKVTKNLRAHYYCLLFSETITQSGRDTQGILGFLPSDILSELCRTKQKQCHYCKEFGATAGCVNKFCNIKFHLPCGMKNRTTHDFDSFTSYCHKHRKSSNVPVRIKRTISNHKCVICLENFHAKIEMTNVIWAECCKADILLHLQCMKKLALSAGYFTKCPGCNNKNEFVTTIKLRGVFVPERDASWELTRNAYSELYYVHDKCDVEKCHCPQGRHFSTDRGKWKFFLCGLCGSFGTHQFCSHVEKEFICNVCNSVDDKSTIAYGNSTSVADNLASTANNTKHYETSNPHYTSISLQSSSTVSFIFNESSNTFTKQTNTSTSSPVRHKTAHLNKTQEVVKNKDYYNKETLNIDPLDDVIVVDYSDDSDDDKELNKITTNFAVLGCISNEITVKASTILNTPTTSKIETEASHSQTIRRVATKSTTKLPYLKEKCRALEKAIHIEEKIINPLDNTILLESNSASDTNNGKELNDISEGFVKHDYISKQENEISPDRFKSKFSHSHKERKIAIKSTTKLPFIKREIGDLENTIKLEKQTINSLDDFDDVIVIDSDEEGNDANTREFSKLPKDIATSDVISKTVIEETDTTSCRPLLNTLKPVSSHSHIVRKVAVKSTTKLPTLKRKNSNDENTPVEQQLQCEKENGGSSNVNKIMPNSDVIISSIERPKKKSRRSVVARMSTTCKSTSRLSNLIKKVHTVIGNQSMCERNIFPLDGDPLADVAHPTNRIEPLYSEENQLHYSIPLDVDSEIEFVNCPNFRVSAQEKACQEQ